jgi:mono/diheme cytochrome c family protein
MRRFAAGRWSGLLLIAGLACSQGDGEEPDAALARGEAIYRNVCQVCHNADPNVAGTLGPAIAGAPVELLMAKVVRGEYPDGHTPARDTAQMPVFAYLEPQIPEVAAFLATQKK